MSENLNRSTEGFSKYDSMSIGELEEILRADARGPERDDSDVDEILYVMEVLAKKRRQNGIAGKTALEAYQEFQQHYLPALEEEEDIEAVPPHKAKVIPFRRIAAVAASLVLVFTLTTSANAFSFRDIWNTVVHWAEETFCFSTDVEVSEPTPNENIQYNSLHDILLANNRSITCVPQWIPETYVFEEAFVSESPVQETYVAVYLSGEKMLKITVQSFLDGAPEQIEESSNLLELYTVSGIDYYIFENHDQLQAVWIIDTFECYISGELSIDEIKLMIDSIEKG